MARSRGNPGNASWQMLLGAFRPQTPTEDKKEIKGHDRSSPFLTSPERRYYSTTRVSVCVALVLPTVAVTTS